jgi:predicted esterase
LVPHAEKISLNKGILELSLTNLSPVKIEIMDVKGNLLKKEFFPTASAGVYRLNIAQHSRATNLLIIHASIGRRVMTFQYLPLHNGKYAVKTSIESLAPMGGRLAKKAAAVDSLKVIAEGYKTKVVTITSYEAEVDITLETASETEPCDGAGSIPEGDSKHELTVGGTTYPFNVHTPPNYNGTTRMPVMFDFHGLGGNENQMIRISGWADVGDAEGFITVFPGGPDNGWNAGGCCTRTPTDVEFVREAIKYLDTEGCIDTKRVYASGCSNGGAFSFRLACEAADIIAAIAPVDFDCVAGSGRCSPCDLERPVTVIQFRGTNDQMVPYRGLNPISRGGVISTSAKDQ